MRVGTYNVLGITGFPKEAAAASLGGTAAAERISHFVEAFSALETDILHLEEGVTLAMAQQLADGMGRYVATFASPMDWSANGLGQGCTGHVISRFPILESRTFSHHPPVQLESPTEAPRSGVGSGLADGGVSSPAPRAQRCSTSAAAPLSGLSRCTSIRATCRCATPRRSWWRQRSRSCWCETVSSFSPFSSYFSRIFFELVLANDRFNVKTQNEKSLSAGHHSARARLRRLQLHD